MTSSGAIPGMSGFRLVEDDGIAQRFDAVDGHGRPVTLVILGEQASADPRMRELFATHAAKASTAALPGELQVTFDSSVGRPWAASYQQPGSTGAERLLPGFLEAARWAPPPAPAPEHQWAPPPPQAWDQPPQQSPPVAQGTPPSGVGWDPASQQWVQPNWAEQPSGEPARRSNATVITVVAVVLLLVVSAGVLIAFVAGGDDEDGSPVAAPPGASDELLPPDLGLDLPPLAPPNKLEGPPPSLDENAPPASIIGPNWGPDEQTQTMAFDGWPFAFRAPPTWGCVLSSYLPTPDAYVFRCVDEQHPDDRQASNIFLRKCPTTCTTDEQTRMNAEWLDEPQRAVPAGPNTVYVETPVNDRGLYSVDSSHFFAEAPGQPLKWQIGVYVESPPDTRDEVLKMMNDIRSQTP